MTQTQFLLFLIAAIPLLNCLFLRLCAHSNLLTNIINKSSPIFFLITLVALEGGLKNDNSYVSIIEAIRGISLGFFVDKISVGFLFLLSFFWLTFAFYSQRFFKILTMKKSDDLYFFFVLIIAFLNFIFISKNLLSALFFYNCLIILSHFFAKQFLHKEETKFSQFFTFLLYLESILFFFAIIATYKFTAQIEFIDGGVISQNFDPTKHSLLLCLYLSGLFLSILIPCYLFYRNISLDPLTIYVLFFLSYAFSSLFIFVKILNCTFGLEGFALIIHKIGFNFFEWIFLINITLASAFLITANGLKTSFFYLFFQQLLFCLFAVFLFSAFKTSKIYLSLFSFLLSFTLIFLCISNFTLYLLKSENKSIEGLFYKLTITSFLFIFATMNLLGFAPGLGAVEKFFLLKIIAQKKLFLSASIVIINFAALLIFAWRNFYPLFLHNNNTKTDELAKDIDFDSSLILTPLIAAIAIFLGLLLFPFLTNFFSTL